LPPYYGHGHIKAFTIEGVSEYRTDLWELAKEKNKRSNYLWTVAKITPKDKP
jgi:hypothetical protein